LAEDRAGEVAAQKAEAERAFRESERNRARSYLHPLGHSRSSAQPDQAELVALDALAQHEGDRFKLFVLAEALADPDDAGRVLLRCDRVAQAVVGLSPRRRAAALGLLTPKLNDTKLDSRVRACAGALAIELGCGTEELYVATVNAVLLRQDDAQLSSTLSRLYRKLPAKHQGPGAREAFGRASVVRWSSSSGPWLDGPSKDTYATLTRLNAVWGDEEARPAALREIVRVTAAGSQEDRYEAASDLFARLYDNSLDSRTAAQVYDCLAQIVAIDEEVLAKDGIWNIVRDGSDRLRATVRGVRRDADSPGEPRGRRYAVALVLRFETSVPRLVELLRDPGCVGTIQDAVLNRLDAIAFPRPELLPALAVLVRPFVPAFTYATVADINRAARDGNRRLRTVSDAAEWLARHHPAIDLDAPFRLARPEPKP
jgi:hypothetical protein